MERHTVSRLIGSPPGYVGYDEGGQLTEKVRRKPYSVVLFDEIEKAHEDVWNVLLQILEDGAVTDSQGRRVDFRNAVILMTSNVGAKSITAAGTPLGFAPEGRQDEDARFRAVKEAVTAELKRTFRPEFLNRVDETIVFRPLSEENMAEIARRLLKKTAARMEALGIRFVFDAAAARLLAQRGTDETYGARPPAAAHQRGGRGRARLPFAGGDAHARRYGGVGGGKRHALRAPAGGSGGRRPRRCRRAEGVKKGVSERKTRPMDDHRSGLRACVMIFCGRMMRGLFCPCRDEAGLANRN